MWKESSRTLRNQWHTDDDTNRQQEQLHREIGCDFTIFKSNYTPLRKDRVGERFTDRDGNTCTIIKYNNRQDVTVEFEDHTLKHTQYGALVRGQFHK